MPILQGDIKLLKSERMTDNEDGGGRITGNAITDGVSNEIFNDVSDLDRVYGRTNLRKVFGGVETDDTAIYFGSHVILDQTPDDPNVSVLLFSTGDASDQRDDARQHVEGYVVAGPLSRLRLYGDQLPGQRSLLAYQRGGETPPDIGDVLMLETTSGAGAGDSQFVRVTGIETTTRTFTDGLGDFARQVVTIAISTELTRRFYGHEPQRLSSTQPPSLLRQTQVADASHYYGAARLADAASLGQSQVRVESIYQAIVPSTTTENAVLDVPAGDSVSLDVTSGGYRHTIHQVGNTTLTAIEVNNRGYTYVKTLTPLPAPGTVVVAYRALGRWYTLRDEAGNGDVTSDGAGVGRIDYTTGSISLTLAALPDTGTALLYTWGTPVHYSDRAGAAEIDGPAMVFDFADLAVVPGSVTATWLAGGTLRTATDDGLGHLTGDASGRVVYGYTDAAGNDRPGQAYLAFAAAAFPDANTTVALDYRYGGHATTLFNPDVDGAGFITLQLPDPPIRRGSVSVAWEITREQYEAEFKEKYGVLVREDYERRSEHVVALSISDDGNGGFQGWDGAIDYATGSVTFQAEPTHTQTYYVDNEGSTQGWHEQEVTDTFAAGAAVYAGHTPDSASPSENRVEKPLPPLTVRLIPHLQDSVVPGTLRFTFRGETYLDRDGALYRNPDAQGAGLYAGTIDYQTGRAVITTWANGGDSAITVDSLVSTFGTWTIAAARFRTPGSPIQPGGFTVSATTADGRLLSGQGDFAGTLSGDEITGLINYDTGVVDLRFGAAVLDSSLSAADKAAPWYDPAAVDELGYVWRPTQVIPSTARFNTVVLTNLPLDAELLGLDPVRLPPDGRVPIYRPANVAVIHHTARTAWPIGTAAGDSLDVGRTRLALAHVEDASGAALPASDYTTELDAGTLTLSATAELAGYTEPLYAVHRVEDMVLVSDVQISGQLTLAGQLSHAYPAGETLVSSAMIAGDLQARATAPFDQTTWTNTWSDSRIGSDTTATYNATTYPIAVTNRGTITERWALIFTSTTSYRVVGESVGQIGTGTINEPLAIHNPNTGVAYFALDALGWGTGWAAGNVLRFNTLGANAPVWLARTVLQGPAEGDDFTFRLQVRGNVDA